LSFTLSNVTEIYFSYKVKCGGVLLYSIVLVIDILLFNEKIPAFLIIINFIAYCIPYKINPNPADNLGLQQIFLNYLNIIVIVYIIRSVIIDKSKTEKLNKELTNANLKLKEYSEKIEELTISKERTRIAQELHDSIGHSLVALRMNLEYAENVVDLKPEKAKEVINKAYTISKDCISKLREVVSVLKEDSGIKNLRAGINELFGNFRDNEKYKFNLKMDDEIEKESTNIKSCIYKTVMEGITNGIKHGNAYTFNIDINKVQDNIILKISNNGLGCRDIKKSNGLNGIEKRIADLGGSVKLYSENDIGFIIDAAIPVLGRKL
jgi:signal transduction histidine kinase